MGKEDEAYELSVPQVKDLGEEQVSEWPGSQREKWWQVWRPKRRPRAPPRSLEDAPITPYATASIFSVLTFQWITPLMVLGYQRPLQATDLWKLPEDKASLLLSKRFLEHLGERQRKAAEWNAEHADELGAIEPDDQGEEKGGGESKGKSRGGRRGKGTGEGKKKYGSVAWALNDTLTGFWSGGLFKVVGDAAQMMAPLIIKQLIRFSQESSAAKREGRDPPSIGAGVGMAFGLLGLTITASICQHQFFFRSMSTGVIARSTLITAIYQRSLELSTSARLVQTNGKLVNAISSDVSRVDYCAQWFHAVWTAPIQLSVCLLLLCLQLGPAAIVGFALFLLVGPLQTFIIKMSFNVRQRSVRWTDKRAQLLRELLGSMRIIKVFVYEAPFLKRLRDIRQKEMQGIRALLFIRSFNQAVAFSVPTLAAVLSFVVYARTHNDLDPALIFTSLALFGLLRQPLMFLPRALSCVADAQSALFRLRQIFEAETASKGLDIQPDLAYAIEVSGTFAWAAEGSSGKAGDKATEGAELQVDLQVKRGELVAVIGAVGCGKSSLLQAIIGEMPVKEGKVRVGAGIAYVQQSAWIQNASLRDNILFGQRFESDRYWQAIRDASLIADLEILPGGDQCEIGEKGINLSGGQKQRVNIARALYHESDIVLLDDPLSAVDAHVAEALFHNAVKTLKSRGATVVMVTHSLHLLSDQAFDRILVMKDRRIVESGTHLSLLATSSTYSQLMTDFAGSRPDDEGANDGVNPNKVTKGADAYGGAGEGQSAKGTSKLIQHETRKTGSIGVQVYAGYLHAGRGAWTFPLTLAMAGIMQAAQVMSTVWITYWEADTFSQSAGFYEGIYAALGIIQALFTFFMGAGIGLVAYYASNTLHADALRHAFAAPMSFYDTTPLGRILNVFGRDVDIVDNQLADSLRMALLTLSTLAGAVIIITVYLHIFIVVIVVVCVGYWYFSLYYRTSARELKRLDSLLRGLFYAHFSESLSGLPTIRAYGEQDRFIREDAYYADLNNRSLFLTTVNQRWLSVRLDALGSLIVFSVAMMAASGTSGISPSEIGLALTYMTQLVQVLGMCTRQLSEVENNCNSVERLLSFSTSLPQEADHTKPAPHAWPAQGAIEFDEVDMAYRPGLPTVLKGVSLSIRGGERIGVVGRTGSGKSSLTVALYRLCELSDGAISIDGVDIASIGLDALRSSIAIIPQDPVLFSGDLRSNLDSFGVYTDAELYDAMKRAHLPERFKLDTAIADEGSNLSVGERSLVSLARASVKKAKIVLLDEATAAVDLETDARIQSTIAAEFSDRTLICIAHRLRTILSWDRILVMDAGRVAEFDTPARLFRAKGQFYEMCVASGISHDEVVR